MNKKRCRSILLSLALMCSMIITVMPLSAFAESTTTTQIAPASRTYKVRHIRQSLNGSYSDESMAEYESLTGNVGERTNASANRSYSGFQALVPEQVKIAPSGDITVSVYYARRSYTTYFKTGDTAKDFYKTYVYGAAQTAPPSPIIPGKNFVRWTYKDDNGVWKTWTPSTQPAKDVTVYAEYDVPAQAEYVINYWYQNNTDEVNTPDDQKTYTLFDHETKTQNVNTPVVYNGATRENTYVKYNQAKTDAENTGKVVGADGKTVVNVYYDRPVMTFTKVYYNLTTGAEEKREDFKGIYGHSTDGIFSLEPELRWTTRDDPDSYTTEKSSFSVAPNFMTGPYKAEFHARRTAVVVQKAIYVIIHNQNVDGTWTKDMSSTKSQKNTERYSNFYTYFTSGPAYKYIFYYWTNGENDFTTDVSAANPALNPYTSNSRIYILRNNQLVNDYDGDGVEYLHAYAERVQYKLRFINADNTPVTMYSGAPLSLAKSSLDNPIRPASVPAHYVFAGWYTDASFKDSTKLTDDAKIGTQDYFLYAKWEEPHVKVTVVSNGAVSELPSTIDIPKMGSVYRDLPMIPSKNGYWFDGWYKDAAFTVPFDVNEAIASDTTIYAKWSSRKPANWEVRYVDAMGRTLARSTRGTDNLYDVLYKEALNIPGYAVDFSSKNITLSNDDSENVIEFVYTAKPRTVHRVNRVSDAPKTGDDNSIGLSMMLLASSVMGLIFALYRRKRSAQ